MIGKRQSKIRKINAVLFVVIVVMISSGQYIIDRATNPSFFIYYYSTIALLTLICFLFTIYDITVLRKKLLLMADEHLHNK